MPRVAAHELLGISVLNGVIGRLMWRMATPSRAHLVTGAVLVIALLFAVPVGGLEFRRSTLAERSAKDVRFWQMPVGPAPAVAAAPGPAPGPAPDRFVGAIDLRPMQAPPPGGGAGGGGAGGGQGSPLLAMYRKYTMQYKEDALEAYAAAKYYAEATQALSNSLNEKEVQARVREKMIGMGVDNWAYAAWAVQGMLNNPIPAKAAAAAAEAAAPYNAAFAAYDKSKVQYNTAATGYALRAKQDAALSQQLMSYANQFRLQGDTTQADQYKGQSMELMKQAVKFKDQANKYQETAQKIYGVLPSIQSWAGKAGAEAAYEANPLGDLPAKEIFPFTVVPPAGIGPPL